MKPLLHYTLFFFTAIGAFAPVTLAQRTDSRRLFWTGADGMEWSANSNNSWMTTGSWLSYTNASPSSAIWLATDALAGTPFLDGDVATFDSSSDIFPDIDPGTGLPLPIDPSAPAATRTINIAPEGVTASNVILSGAGSFVFTGGAITTDAGSVAPGSTQLTGTSAPTTFAYQNLAPAGHLIKANTGDLTLSNTVANVFTGGIHIAAGSLTIANNRALGDNNISLLLASTAAANDIHLPAIVTGANGSLLRVGTNLISPVTLRVPVSADGLDITGDIYLNNRLLTLDIEGDTTISGRILGASNNRGSTGGYITKTGQGTLTITGTTNWFYGSVASSIESGRVVVTGPYALGTGAWSISPGAALEFRGVKGTMKQSFIGNGTIDITEGSDLVFNWRNGPLFEYETDVSTAPSQPASNIIGTINITGASRFSAIASGTYASVLGGGNAQVFVREQSTLVIGREGLSSRGTRLADGTIILPMDFPIQAGRVSFAGASTLILNPNANLNTGMLDFSNDSFIAFGASGVSRLRYLEGTPPDQFQYFLPEGMTLIVNELPVVDGYHREFVVVNQGANPLKDIAMTLNALDAVHETLSARLAGNFIDPPDAPHRLPRGRKWTHGVWARGIYSQLDYDNVSITTPGASGRISGAVLGMESTLPGRLLFGFHAGVMSNNLDTTNNTSLGTQQRFLGVHAAQRFGRAYIAGSAAMGRVRTDSNRHEPANLVRGTWNTTYYSASLEVGATFAPWKKTTLRPYASLRYANLKIHNHYERGPSPLLIDDFNDTGAQVVAGLVAGRKFTVFKRALAVDLTLARKHAVKTPRDSLITHYYDAPTTPITLERGDYYSDITAIGLSLRWAVSRNTLAGLSGDYETASAYTRTTFTALVGYTW